MHVYRRHFGKIAKSKTMLRVSNFTTMTYAEPAMEYEFPRTN